MTYTITKLPEEPIIVATGHADFSISEAADMMEEAYRLLDAQTEPVYYVSDISSIHLSLDDVLQGSSLVTRGQKPVLLHPHILQNVFVASSSFLRMAAKGLSSPVFGGKPIYVCETLDDGLAYCRGNHAGG